MKNINAALFTDATYNPEDNKLRLYTSERLPSLLFDRLRADGFQLAPLQKCFFATWSPYREDICIELFGVVSRDQTTFDERAKARINRFDKVTQNHIKPADVFTRAALRVKSYEAQPPQQLSIDNVNYWHYHADSSAAVVNMKLNTRTVAHRIDSLLKQLKHEQLSIHHGHILIDIWTNISQLPNATAKAGYVQYYLQNDIKTGTASKANHKGDLANGILSIEEVIAQNIQRGQNIVQSSYTQRFIIHILNRLAFERNRLGHVRLFRGKLSAQIVQEFLRANGAFTPVAKKFNDAWAINSPAALPLHIGNGTELVLTEMEVRELMREVGYSVPTPRVAKPPILNFHASEIEVTHHREAKWYPQITFTKAQYANVHNEYRAVLWSNCKKFRVRVCQKSDPNGLGPMWCCVFLKDSAIHPTPISGSVKTASSDTPN